LNNNITDKGFVGQSKLRKLSNNFFSHIF